MNKLIYVMEKCIAALASAAMAGIVIMVFLNVVLRYVMNSGLTWSDEVAVNLFVWFIFLGAVLAAMQGLHLKVDVLTSRLSPKLQKLCSFIANIFVLLSMGILALGGYRLVLVTNNNVSSATGLPFSYITVSLVFFAVCVIGLTLRQMYEEWRNTEAMEGDKR